MPNQPKKKPKDTTTKNAAAKKTAAPKKEPETVVGPRRPLLRSRNDRVLWGVAGGLAEHLGFSAILVRIAFVLTTLFGGAGILAYLVLAVALPEDDGQGNPVAESVWVRLGKVVLICFLVGLALFAAAGLAVASAWATATGHGAVVAVVLAALGVTLVAGALPGTGCRRIIPWLVTAGVLVRGRLRGIGSPQDHPVAGHGGCRARRPRWSGGVRRHPFLRVDRRADLHTDGGRGPPRRDLRAGHRPADRRSEAAAVGEGQDLLHLPSPRHGPDDR